MKNKLLLPIILICLTFGLMNGLSYQLPAQGSAAVIPEKITEFWQAVGADITVNDIFKVYLEKQMRYREKFSNLRADFYEAGVRVRLNKLIAFRLNYRYTYADTRRRYRFDGNVNLSFRLRIFKNMKRFRFYTRTKLQRDFTKDVGIITQEWVLRNRVKVATPRLLPKIRPYFSYELFKGLGAARGLDDKFRFSVGFEWAVKKRVTIKPFYHYQKDLVVNKSETRHIFGAKFNYSF